jgi:hypothetical protein
MATFPSEFYSFMQKELSPIYLSVKRTIIEAETHDPLKRSYLAPYNELRNTLDHIIKAAICTETKDLMNNLREAKVHINRAGYDVYEILASNLGIYINKTMINYSSTVINSVFPAYYTEIQPLLIEVQKEIIDIRSNKNIDGEINPEPFEKYEKNKDHLIKIIGTIQGYIPLLEAEKKKQKKFRIGSWLVNNLVAVIIGIIIGLVLFLLLPT